MADRAARYSVLLASLRVSYNMPWVHNDPQQQGDWQQQPPWQQQRYENGLE